jgi:hypothetical protein
MFENDDLLGQKRGHRDLKPFKEKRAMTLKSIGS